MKQTDNVQEERGVDGGKDKNNEKVSKKLK